MCTHERAWARWEPTTPILWCPDCGAVEIYHGGGWAPPTGLPAGELDCPHDPVPARLHCVMCGAARQTPAEVWELPCAELVARSQRHNARHMAGMKAAAKARGVPLPDVEAVKAALNEGGRARRLERERREKLLSEGRKAEAALDWAVCQLDRARDAAQAWRTRVGLAWSEHRSRSAKR